MPPKAVSLLNPGGLLYICASPNSDSLCFNLFREKHNQPVNETNQHMFNEKLLSEYFAGWGLPLIGEKPAYLGTPYENIREDVKKIARAIRLEERGKQIDFSAPAFFDNMLTLV